MFLISAYFFPRYFSLFFFDISFLMSVSYTCAFPSHFFQSPNQSRILFHLFPHFINHFFCTYHFLCHAELDRRIVGLGSEGTRLGSKREGRGSGWRGSRIGN
ncbi:hypothetical protein DFH27DRAFT_542725 [Peziza echinospora]|nr:hypothetical protein DFH27DRAFT_542725 [Peziza echinospora]